MNAIRLHAFGPAENLRYEVVDDPDPGPGQVRIAVAAAGVHLIDTALRAGRQISSSPLAVLPAVPGREVAGVVDAVGSGVESTWIGRRVVAHLGIASGGYAEKAACDVERLHVIPEAATDAAAVAMIGTGRTTMTIVERALLEATDVVVVTAAAGGIGSLLVQAGHKAGATVVAAVGGPAKMETARQLGADIVVDYDEVGWSDIVRAELNGREVTAVLDGVGGDRGRQAFELLGPGGRLVLFGWSSGSPTALSSMDLFARGVTASAAIGPKVSQGPGDLRRIEGLALDALASGHLVPLVGQSFPLAEAAAAHRAIENRATVGKTVLLP